MPSLANRCGAEAGVGPDRSLAVGTFHRGAYRECLNVHAEPLHAPLDARLNLFRFDGQGFDARGQLI